MTWNWAVYEKLTVRWKNSCGIAHSSDSYRNGIEKVYGLKRWLNLLKSGRKKINLQLNWTDWKKNNESTTTYKNNCYFVLKQRSLHVCYIWFSCGKSSHTKPQLFLYINVSIHCGTHSNPENRTLKISDFYKAKLWMNCAEFHSNAD